jgi:hypothetical protein
MPIRRQEHGQEKSGGRRRTRSFNNRNLRLIDRDGDRRDQHDAEHDALGEDIDPEKMSCQSAAQK